MPNVILTQILTLDLLFFLSSSLAVGTRLGYKLYSLNSTEVLEAVHVSGGGAESAAEEVLIAERLFSSSLVAVVARANPKKLLLCHFKKGTAICDYSYTTNILAVKLNRAVRGSRERGQMATAQGPNFC